MSLRTSARVAVAAACLLTPALVTGPLQAQGASVESATPEQKKAAQKAFEKGMAAQKKKQPEEALAAFRDSYNHVASPNSHLMVARALAELDRLEEAYSEYESTIAEAKAAAQTDKKYEQTQQAAEKELGDVRAKLALLTVQVSGAGEGARVSVRGRELPASDWGKPIAVRPGSVTVELTTASGQKVTEEVTAEAGGSPSVTLSPAAPAPAPARAEASAEASLDTGGGGPSMRTWAYVAGGVGIAGLATFGVFGALNNSKYGKLEDECSGGVCSKDLEEDADTGRTYQTIANVGLVVGIVGIGAGTALYFLSGKEEKTADRQRTRRAASQPRWDVNVGPRWVSVSGQF